MADWTVSDTRWFVLPDPEPVDWDKAFASLTALRHRLSAECLFEWLDELLMYQNHPEVRPYLSRKWMLHWGSTIVYQENADGDRQP